MTEGEVKEGWFVNIPLNNYTSLTFEISRIEEVELAGEKDEKYLLLVVTNNNEALDLLLELRVGSELLTITREH